MSVCVGTDIQISLVISWCLTPIALAFLIKMTGNFYLCVDTMKLRETVSVLLCKEKNLLHYLSFVTVLFFLLAMQATQAGCGYIVVDTQCAY